MNHADSRLLIGRQRYLTYDMAEAPLSKRQRHAVHA
jgi:hypothetical protein